jgi:hypothetical protein
MVVMHGRTECGRGEATGTKTNFLLISAADCNARRGSRGGTGFGSRPDHTHIFYAQNSYNSTTGSWGASPIW